MRILIISFDADPPYKGGTSTVANVLAKGFISKGFFCALGYMGKSDNPSVFFKDKIRLEEDNREAAIQFFKKHSFDIILNQLPTTVDFKFLLEMPIGNCKIISAYHNRPILRPVLLQNLWGIYKESKGFSNKLYVLAKLPLIPLMNIRAKKIQLKKFSDVCTYSDKILLLSKRFFPVWIKLLPQTKVEKLIAIGNPLVFEKSFSQQDYGKKEKLVIAVCSANYQKRAYLMLKIWKMIEEDARLLDWKFEFVGGGEGFDQLKTLAKTLNLKRLHFVGYQNPYSYYQRASIMMMTSKFEGWPMVLMEGQQMGVIPVSYNSYESITDIIKDGENGVIVENNNMRCFVDKMKAIMLDEKKRERMSGSAIISSERFTIDNIISQYIQLFEGVIEKKPSRH